MTTVYVIALFAGAPLLLWFVFGGGEIGGDADFGGDLDGSTGHFNHLFAAVSLSTLVFFMTAFGGVGLALTALGSSEAVTFVAALIAACLVAILNSAVFRYLRRTESSSDIMDSEIEGSLARVLMPITHGHRGRIVLKIGGARSQMTAELIEIDDQELTLEKDTVVMVVSIQNGVAQVTPVDPIFNLAGAE